MGRLEPFAPYSAPAGEDWDDQTGPGTRFVDQGRTQHLDATQGSLSLVLASGVPSSVPEEGSELHSVDIYGMAERIMARADKNGNRELSFTELTIFLENSEDAAFGRWVCAQRQAGFRALDLDGQAC